MNKAISISLTEMFGIFLFGFTFFIACFNTEIAKGYILFIASCLLLTIILKTDFKKLLKGGKQKQNGKSNNQN